MTSASTPDERETWDVVVIGAGVAGAASAMHLATPRRDVLLAERATWPRDKVCGCCLNPAGVRLLEDAMVAEAIREKATRVSNVLVRCNQREATLSHEGGLAIRRRDLDEILVRAAIERGVRFAPETSIRVVGRSHGHWDLESTSNATTMRHRSRIVVVADGIQGRSLRTLDGFESRVCPGSRVGISCLAPTARPMPDVIRMTIGRHGYVGAVDLPDGLTAVAAAVDPTWMKSCGGPILAMSALLGTRTPAFNLEGASTLGTSHLTRSRRRVAAPGLFVIGDSSRYVEPLSGEGMTWALASARVLAGIVDAGATSAADAEDAWRAYATRGLRRRQRWAGLLRLGSSRWPRLASCGVALASTTRGRSFIESALRHSSRPYLAGPEGAGA